MNRLVGLALVFGCLSTSSCSSGPKDKLIGRWEPVTPAAAGMRFANTVGMMEMGPTVFADSGTVTTTTKHGTFFAHFTVVDSATLEIEELGMEMDGKKTDYEKGKGGTTKTKFNFAGDQLTITPLKEMAGLPKSVTLRRLK